MPHFMVEFANTGTVPVTFSDFELMLPRLENVIDRGTPTRSVKRGGGGTGSEESHRARVRGRETCQLRHSAIQRDEAPTCFCNPRGWGCPSDSRWCRRP